MSCSGYIQPSPKVIRIIDQEQDEVHLVNLDFLSNLSLRGGGKVCKMKAFVLQFNRGDAQSAELVWRR